MSFPAYANYRDSGVEWLGDVPGHWDIAPLKRFGTFEAGAGFPHDEQGVEGEELPFFKVNALGKAGSDGRLRDSSDTVSRETAACLRASVFPTNTIVLAKIGAALLLGRLRMLSQPSCLDNNMMGYIAAASHSADFFRSLMSLVRFDFIANPGTVPSLNEAQIANLRFAIPPLPEQRAIAAFLNRETGKIDALVAEQRRMIELLKEKRQAVISHAVTKGLNPDAPMKPSGIEWLGDVPDHWQTMRLRFLVALNPSKREADNLGPEQEVSFLPMEAVGDDGSLDLSRTRPIGEVDTGYTYFREGDVAFAKITPCFENGKGAVMRSLLGGIGFGTTELTVVRPRDQVASANYINWLFSSPSFHKLGAASMYGAGGQKRVPDDFVRNFGMAFPPLPEQTAIAAFLDHETGKIDALVAEQRRLIALLKERRSALISASVTGKIDVRGRVSAETEAA